MDPYIRYGEPMELQILLDYNSHHPWLLRADGNWSPTVSGGLQSPHLCLIWMYMKVLNLAGSTVEIWHIEFRMLAALLMGNVNSWEFHIVKMANKLDLCFRTSKIHHRLNTQLSFSKPPIKGSWSAGQGGEEPYQKHFFCTIIHSISPTVLGLPPSPPQPQPYS